MSETGPRRKIAYKTNAAKNRLQDGTKNRPQDDAENRPDIINPVPLCGILGEAELKALLKSKKQTAWCTRVRLLGLLLVIDYICRNFKNGMISISADLAHQFVSKLRNSRSGTMITEPLLVLCEIGILETVRPAVFAHVKASAVYRFAFSYRQQLRLKIVLTPKLARKQVTARGRREQRLNRKFPWREQLLADLCAINFSDSARRIIGNRLLGKRGENLKRLVSAVDAQLHFVIVSERGQITTSLGSCPRELQPHLLLRGSPIVFCDISNAHWNFLPRILVNRLRDVSRESGFEKYVNDGWREHNRLIALLSGGDFYRRWCVDPQSDGERNQKKNLLIILLNKKNEDCERNILYRRIVAEFPITSGIVEDIKRNDHRNLSKQLHRFTADAIAAAFPRSAG